MSEHGPPETVYVENDWYDGPRAGVADIGGQPHRFKSLFDDSDDEYLGTFLTWPIERNELDLEIEQWRIFAAWNALYEVKSADVESHPAHGGRNTRWDEIEAILRPSREQVPNTARRAVAQIEWIDTAPRYSSSGPGYKMRWKIL